MEKAVFKPVYDRRKASGYAPVEIYCYHLGRKKYIKTGINIYPEQWDKKKRRVNDTHINHMRINYLITKSIADLEQYEIETIEKTGRFSLDDLSKFTEKKDHDNFISFMQAEINADMTVSPGTKRYRDRTVKYLKAAVGEISFKNLDYEALSKFNDYMVKIGLSIATRKNHHNQLKKFAQIAVNKRKLSQNPYMLYKIKRPPKQLKKCLWYDDLDRLWELKYNDEHEAVRLKFLFACYTGLRISDVSSIKVSDVRNGKIFLTMQKTGLPLVVPLDVVSDRGKVIYKLCCGEDREHIFGKMSDQKTNAKLKKIGIDAGINFPLNFHVARHTFCTLIAHKTGSVFAVMQYAGIYKVETAMTYVNLARLFS